MMVAHQHETPIDSVDVSDAACQDFENQEGRILTIVSGGQTGVDRAALDVAIELDLPHGGWCPAGRKAEDGPIPARYLLQETRSAEYRERTRRNVEDADATLIICAGPLNGGTALTLREAKRLGRPHRIVDLVRQVNAGVATARWLERRSVKVLNVAGPRGSQYPGIGTMTKRFLRDLISQLG